VYVCVHLHRSNPPIHSSNQPLTHKPPLPSPTPQQATTGAAASSSSGTTNINPAQRRAAAERQLAILETALKPEHVGGAGGAGALGLELERLRCVGGFGWVDGGLVFFSKMVGLWLAFLAFQQKSPSPYQSIKHTHSPTNIFIT
jgi:hypothetical protein